MPKALVYIILIVITLAMIPPAVIAWARATPSEKPRIHPIQDMDNMARFKAQQASDLFADDRAMRPPIEGAVARGQLGLDLHYERGVVDGAWAETFPPQVEVDMTLLERGRERYDIYCSVCHGQAGYGNGIVNKRAQELMKNPAISNGTQWVAPKNIHEPAIRDQPVGQIYNTITHGVRNMAGYGAQIPVDDRWAIVAYVEALQRSQNAEPQDVPAEQREDLEVIDLRPPPADEGEEEAGNEESGGDGSAGAADNEESPS